MNRRTLLVIVAGLLAVVLVASVVGAQSSTSFDLSWYAMAGGGRRAESASYALHGTLGQGLVSVSNSPGYQMHSGYWHGLLSLARYHVYLPLVARDWP